MRLSATLWEAYDRARDAVAASSELSRALIQDGEAEGLERHADPIVYGFQDQGEPLVDVEVTLKHEEWIEIGWPIIEEWRGRL